MYPVHELSSDQSWTLLGSHTFGRLAVNLGVYPEIFPINYLADAESQTLLFRTAEGTKLFGVTVHPRVTFEVDDFSDIGGWSVVLKGTAHVLEAETEIEAADVAGLRPWVPTLKRTYVRVQIEEISGRRFDFGEEPSRDEPSGAS